MADISKIAKGISKAISDNSPSILTSVAVAGVLSTAIFVAKATMKATRNYVENEDKYDEIDNRRDLYIEVVKDNWKYYVPSLAIGTATVACVIGANSISSRRNAALISVYSLTETAFKEYKAKVVETIGQNKEQKVREEIAKDHLLNAPMYNAEVLITGSGEQLCYDSFTGRYFKSDIETIRKAQNDINARVLNDMYASHNDFYHLINLPGTKYGEEVGWNIDNLMDIEFTAHLADDGRPCLCLEYHSTPIRGYYKLS